MPADNEMPDVAATLGQIELARAAVQDAVGRGRLLMHMPPRSEIDHDIIIWDALLNAKLTIGGLTDALGKTEERIKAYEMLDAGQTGLRDA